MELKDQSCPECRNIEVDVIDCSSKPKWFDKYIEFYYICKKCKYEFRKDDDDEVDGRWLEAVNEYASTCDGCGELTHHDNQTMDKETQLGYCPECMGIVEE